MEWQPIESAPTGEVEEILLWAAGSCHVGYVGWFDDEKPVWFNGDVAVVPSHWLPLPPRPVTSA